MQMRIYRERHSLSSTDEVPIDYFEQLDGTTDDDIRKEDWDRCPTPTFTEIGTGAFGSWGGLMVDVCIIITQLGGCIAYVIFISQNMSKAVGLTDLQWVFLMFIPFLAIGMVRRIETLAPTALLGNLVYVFAFAVVFYLGGTETCCVAKDDINWSDVAHYPLIFGTCSFSLEGIALVLPVKEGIRNQKDFVWIMRIALAIVTFIYFLFASLGYLMFGNDVANSVRIALSIGLYFTYGLMVYPVALFFDQVLDGYLGVNLHALTLQRKQEVLDERRAAAAQVGDVTPISMDDIEIDQTPAALIPEVASKRATWQFIHRVLFCVFCSVVAITFPDFKLIIELFGSFSNALLAFILPALFWIRICASEKLYGFAYFPYDRRGNALTHPLSRDSADDEDYGATADDASVQLPSSSSELQTLRRGVAGATWQHKASWLALPFVVAVLGTMASAIGVTDAIKDIIAAL
jgi:proton-coupled amino acid transporter